jgi:hypothetical protein
MIHLLNTAIIPAQAGDCDIQVFTLNLDEFRNEVCGNAWESHVGHAGTAAVLSEMLGQEVPMSREPWDGSGTGIAFQLTKRLGEGQILTEEELRSLDFIIREIRITPIGSSPYEFEGQY